MDELVDFLRAQFDEEADEARAAGGDEWRRQDHPLDTVAVYDSQGEPVVYDEGEPSEAQQVHIARHDPARVLRDVDAKRRVLDTLHEEGGDRMFADIFRLLALPYADRPGYREEWRP